MLYNYHLRFKGGTSKWVWASAKKFKVGDFYAGKEIVGVQKYLIN